MLAWWFFWIFILIISAILHLSYHVILKSSLRRKKIENLLKRTLKIEESNSKLQSNQQNHFRIHFQSLSNLEKNNSKKQLQKSSTISSESNSTNSTTSTSHFKSITMFPIVFLPIPLLLEEIFSFLDTQDLISLEKTCKFFNLIIHQNSNRLYSNVLQRLQSNDVDLKYEKEYPIKLRCMDLVFGNQPISKKIQIPLQEMSKETLGKKMLANRNSTQYQKFKTRAVLSACYTYNNQQQIDFGQIGNSHYKLSPKLKIGTVGDTLELIGTFEGDAFEWKVCRVVENGFLYCGMFAVPLLSFLAAIAPVVVAEFHFYLFFVLDVASYVFLYGDFMRVWNGAEKFGYIPKGYFGSSIYYALNMSSVAFIYYFPYSWLMARTMRAMVLNEMVKQYLFGFYFIYRQQRNIFGMLPFIVALVSALLLNDWSSISDIVICLLVYPIFSLVGRVSEAILLRFQWNPSPIVAFWNENWPREIDEAKMLLFSKVPLTHNNVLKRLGLYVAFIVPFFLRRL